jgi:hypothetical protein
MDTWIRKYPIGDKPSKSDFADMVRFTKRGPNGKASGAKRIVNEHTMDVYLIHGTLDDLKAQLVQHDYTYDQDCDLWYPNGIEAAVLEKAKQALVKAGIIRPYGD